MYYRIVFILLVLFGFSFAETATQMDWTGGDGFPGPEPEWGRKFYNSDGINWGGIPGELLLMRESITPVESEIFTGFAGADFCAPADMDGDGDMDILVTGSTANEIAWWENTNGLGTAWTAHTIDNTFDGASCCFAADVDNDGDIDAFGTSPDLNTLSWFENTNGLGTAWTEHIIDSSLSGVDYCFAADFGYDSDMDIVASSSTGDWLYWWENEDTLGTVWDKILIDNAATDISSFCVADYDGDSHMDVVGTHRSEGEIYFYENKYGAGHTWGTWLVTSEFPGASSCYMGDIDGDTDIDILATQGTGNKIMWIPNILSQDGSRAYLIDDNITAPNNCYLADMDADGDLDALATSGDGEVIWYENAGGIATVWEKHIINTGFAGACCIRTGDFNDDDMLDVAAVDEIGGDASWWTVVEFPDTGTLESTILTLSDIPGAQIEWGTITWIDTLPSGTEIAFQVRASDDYEHMGNWSTDIAVSGTDLSPYLASGVAYFQYKALLRPENNLISPALDEIGIDWTVTGGEVITVLQPDSNTVWSHYGGGYEIHWIFPATVNSPPGETACITLYMGEQFIDTLIASTPNDSLWTYSGPVPVTWEPNRIYRVKVEDETGNFGWSNNFEIVHATGQEVIEVTAPNQGDIWYHYEVNTVSEWRYQSDIRSGDSIKIDIYQDGVFLSGYGNWMLNMGTYTHRDPIDPGWGSGDTFRLKVYDEYENYGWSQEFTISPGEVIDVTKPNEMTEWVHYSTDNLVMWDTKTTEATSIDIILYLEDDVIDILVEGTENDGEWILETPVPGDWVPSNKYAIKIVDNFGDWGWSPSFNIVSSGGSEIIEITEPGISTVWTHFGTDYPVEWRYASMLDALVGDSVSIALYNAEEFIYQLTASTENDGEWMLETPVPMDWTPGTEYRIYIEDDLANYGWSCYFEIAPVSGQEIITVTAPASSTVWSHFESDLPVEWRYPAVLSGDSVSIALYNGESLVDVLTTSTENDGEWLFEELVPMSWTPGTEYRIYIMDNLYNYGWSEYFEVASASAEIITVTEPSSETVWQHLETNTVVDWEYPILIISQELSTGDSVYIELWQSGVYLADYTSGMVPNSGSYTREDSIPEAWGTGSDFQIKIMDDLDNWGFSDYFTIEEFQGIAGGIADTHRLLPIAPNPTVGSFAVRFIVPELSHVTIGVFDLSGRLVTLVVDSDMESGMFSSQVSGLPAGIYICRMISGDFRAVERVVVR